MEPQDCEFMLHAENMELNLQILQKGPEAIGLLGYRFAHALRKLCGTFDRAEGQVEP